MKVTGTTEAIMEALKQLKTATGQNREAGVDTKKMERLLREIQECTEKLG